MSSETIRVKTKGDSGRLANAAEVIDAVFEQARGAKIGLREYAYEVLELTEQKKKPMTAEREAKDL